MIQVEDLQCKGLKIMQDKSLYTFTSDSVVLANFIKVKRGERALEIGTGSGVISLLLTAKMNPKEIVAFEIQPGLASLAEENVKLNHIENIRVIADRIQNYKRYFKDGEFDVVFSNPPYMTTDENFKNRLARDTARHDSSLKIDELCECAGRALKFGGRFYLVYDPSRVCELIYNLVKYKLEPKVMFFTENGKHQVKLVVIEAVKGGKHGVKVLPPLETNDSDGKYIEALHTRNFVK